MIMAQSLFMALKRQHPESYLAVLAPPATLPLIKRMPEVDSGIVANFKHKKIDFAERWRVAKELRKQHFDQAIILPGSIKSALAPWLAGISRRTGFLGESRYGLINDVRPLDKVKLPLTVNRFVYLGSIESEAFDTTSYRYPELKICPSDVAIARDKLNLNNSMPVIALCPGAEYGPAKQWPAKHFAALIDQLVDIGMQCWLFGSNKDTEITANILDLLNSDKKHCIGLAGKTSLTQAIDLMSAAKAVISNDSGLMHVAAALKRPVVALYGSSSHKFTPPLSNQATIINLELECSPCFKRQCPLGHLRCLNELTPQMVRNALQTML